MSSNEFSHVPVIDVAPLVRHIDQRVHTAEQIGAACRESGFFYVVNHGVDESLCQRLEALSREFFAQSESQKSRSRCRAAAGPGADTFRSVAS